MKSLFKPCLPLFESALIGREGFMIFPMVWIFDPKRLTPRSRVGGHLHVADFFAALFTFPFCPVDALFFPGFAGGTYLLSPGELCRGLVEVVFFTPMHVGMITRKRKEIKA